MADAPQPAAATQTPKSQLQISNPALFSSPESPFRETPRETTLATLPDATASSEKAAATLPVGASVSLDISFSETMSGQTASGTSQTQSSSSLVSASAISVTTTTPSAVIIDNSKKVDGLIAGLVVFALLFLAMTGMLIWVLRRRRSQHYKEPDSPFSTETKQSIEPAVTGLEHTIASLETQLHEKDEQLRERQMLMISKGQSISRAQTISRSLLSDEEIRKRFTALQKSISSWVSTYFGGAKFASSPISDVVSTLKRTFPKCQAILKDNGMVKVVLEAIVADMLCQAFASGQLLGNEAFWELKQAILSKVPPAEANEWRAMTTRLLEKTPSYRSDRKEAVEDLSQMIDTTCSELTKTRPKQERRTSLEQIVDAAAGLSLDIAKQRALFKVEKPVSMVLNSETMEPIDGSENVIGKEIRAVVFPMVTKYGGEAGSGWDRSLVVMKAKVLS